MYGGGGEGAILDMSLTSFAASTIIQVSPAPAPINRRANEHIIDPALTQFAVEALGAGFSTLTRLDMSHPPFAGGNANAPPLAGGSHLNTRSQTRLEGIRKPTTALGAAVASKIGHNL